MVVQAGTRTTLQPRMQPVQAVQTVGGMQTVMMAGQLVRSTRVATPAPAPRPAPPPRPRAPATQQIVVNNPALVQQIAAGKIQLATVNGQQVYLLLEIPVNLCPL